MPRGAQVQGLRGPPACRPHQPVSSSRSSTDTSLSAYRGLELKETEEEEAREEEAAQGKDPCKAVKNTLGDKVDKFVVSNRISDSP